MNEGSHLRVAEGDEWSLRSTSLKTRPATNEGSHLRVAEGDEWSLRSTSLKTRTFRAKGIAFGNEGDG